MKNFEADAVTKAARRNPRGSSAPGPIDRPLTPTDEARVVLARLLASNVALAADCKRLRALLAALERAEQLGLIESQKATKQ